MPKGLERVGGRRIIDRIADSMHDVLTNIMIVSNDAGAAAWIPEARVVTDLRQELSSLVGVHSAIVHAAAPVLVVAWDMPFVNRELLALIRDRASGSAYAAVPSDARGLQPLCAAYAPACLPWIEAALDGGDFRVHALFERLPSFDRISGAELAAAGDPSRLFFNVNDAAGLEAANRMAAA